MHFYYCHAKQTLKQYILFFSFTLIKCNLKFLNFSFLINDVICISLGESFEEVIYPKGDPDAVSISKRDIELLQPETFINDTIIDFYIK